jgi:hypothetical protein
MIERTGPSFVFSIKVHETLTHRVNPGIWEGETKTYLTALEPLLKTRRPGAVTLAGFDEVEADKLRKVIAKKAGSIKLAHYEQQFFEGCKRNGVDGKTTKRQNKYGR